MTTMGPRTTTTKRLRVCKEVELYVNDFGEVLIMYVLSRKTLTYITSKED